MATPRSTCPYLDSYVGRNVMLVGKVTQLRGDSATLDADGNVTALLNPVRQRFPLHLILQTPDQTPQEAHLATGNAAQIIGKVNPDLSIKALSSLDLGSGVGECSLPLLVDLRLWAFVPSLGPSSVWPG